MNPLHYVITTLHYTYSVMNIGSKYHFELSAKHFTSRCVEITHNRMFKPWQYVDFIFNKTQSGMYFNIINIHNQYLRNFIKQVCVTI